MAKRISSSEIRNNASTRERVKREIAVLKAIGATPQRFLASRSERTTRVRVGLGDGEARAEAVTDVGAVRALAGQIRRDMQPHLDNSRRTLLAELKHLTPDSSEQRIADAVRLLEALRCFDPTAQALEEAAETLGALVHGERSGYDAAGGTLRRNH